MKPVDVVYYMASQFWKQYGSGHIGLYQYMINGVGRRNIHTRIIKII